MIPKPCEDLEDVDLEFSALVSNYEIRVSGKDMLIPGSRVGASRRDGVCFLAIFRNPQLNNDEGEAEEWIFGSVLMQNYYWVFDASKKPLEAGFGYRSDKLTTDDNADNYYPDELDFNDEDKFLIVAIVGSLLLICGAVLICLKCNGFDDDKKSPQSRADLIRAQQANQNQNPYDDDTLKDAHDALNASSAENTHENIW